MNRGLSRKLVLEERQGTPDGAGGLDAGWVALGVHWGEISARAGRFAALRSAGKPLRRDSCRSKDC